jgi:hypothetical protein
MSGRRTEGRTVEQTFVVRLQCSACVIYLDITRCAEEVLAGKGGGENRDNVRTRGEKAL